MNVECDGKEFQIGNLGLVDALQLARKVANVAPIIDGLVKPENSGKDRTMLMLLAIAQLSDDAAQDVIRICTKEIRIKQPETWARLTDKNGDVMFDDITLTTLLTLTVHSIEVNVGPFFRTALGALEQPEANV